MIFLYFFFQKKFFVKFSRKCFPGFPCPSQKNQTLSGLILFIYVFFGAFALFLVLPAPLLYLVPVILCHKDIGALLVGG